MQTSKVDSKICRKMSAVRIFLLVFLMFFSLGIYSIFQIQLLVSKADGKNALLNDVGTSVTPLKLEKCIVLV